MRKRILSLFLAAALVAGLLPTTALAANTIAGAGQLNEYANTQNAPIVYYGKYNGTPLAWYVIGCDGGGVASTAGTATLLAGDNITRKEFNENSSNKAYSGSTLQATVNDIASNFSSGEQAAVKARNLTAEKDNIAGGPVTGASLWPLSTSEAGSVNERLRAIGDYWWLRSPNSDPTVTPSAAVVYGNGYVYDGGYPVDTPDVGVRPAFNLDLSSVLFASAAGNGKPAKVSSYLSAVTTNTSNEWKLTIADADHAGFRVTNVRETPTGFTFDYSGARGDSGIEFISAVVMNADGAVTHYGKVLRVDNDADTDVPVTLPDGVTLDGNTKLYVFQEQCNGNQMTDYASPLTELAANAPIPTLGGGAIGQGDSVYFGTYQQKKVDTLPGDWEEGVDYVVNDGENYSIDPIQWRVLSTTPGGKKAENLNWAEHDGLFLLSNKTLDVGQFNSNYKGENNPELRKWENSALRAWLKETFVGAAFNTLEKTAVLETRVETPENTYSSGPPTEDKVFLLSIKEAFDPAYGFTEIDSTRIAEPTDYAKKQASEQKGDATWWWLRSPGDFNDGPTAAVVNRNGLVYGGGGSVYTTYGVRPAFNLNRDSVLFASAAEGGKSNTFAKCLGDSITNWKLTLAESGKSITGSGIEDGQQNAVEKLELTAGYSAGPTLTVKHKSLASISNDYTNITAALTDSSGKILYYGSINTDTGAVKSTVEIPTGLGVGSYTLSVRGEDWNGDQQADYATADALMCTFTVKAKEPAPTTATFTATGYDSGTLSGVGENMTYKIGSGAWNDIKSNNNIPLTGLNPCTISVVKKGVGTNTADSDPQTIAVTRAETPALEATQPSTTGGKGSIPTTAAHEYSTDNGTNWTPCAGALTGLSAGDYLVRVKASGTKLTSDFQKITINTVTNTGGGGSSSSYDDDDDTPPKSPAQQAADKIESAQPGDTVELKLPSSGKVDKEVFESLAGNDVTLEISLPGGLTWTVNGTDIPKGTNFSDLNLGVNLGTNGISAEVINKVTGEKTSIQLTLSHDGPFGFALTLTAPLGKENAGFWANLYHFNEKTGVLDYESSTIIGTDGAAALKLTHASQYAIVIDDKSHAPKTPWENPFTDVSETDWFYENVRYSCENGLITGTSATTFAPPLPTTRAMLMTILARLDGADTTPTGDIWYEKGMAWAVQNKISDGTNPDASITREQLAVMLYRYAQKQGEDTAETVGMSGFADAEQVSDWARDALRWAVSRGIITGTTSTTLTPAGQATRAEAAAMLQRYLEK